MDRLEWALQNKDRYMEWCQKVQEGPISPLGKLEFALISAHCPMELAIQGWEAIQGNRSEKRIKEILVESGVFAPAVKAERVSRMRHAVKERTLEIPTEAPFREWRNTVSIPGLGLCKRSFGACLINPLSADVVCLDTHICQIYNVNPDWCYRKAENYEVVENLLKAEAESVGMPPFAYQWAIWGWKRSQGNQRGVWGSKDEDHSFLWKGGRTEYQPKLWT